MRGRRSNRRDGAADALPQILSLTADSLAIWPDYVSVSCTTGNADSVRLELDGYTTQTVTAAQAAAGIRLQSDGTAPVVANRANNVLTVTPLRGSAVGAASTANIATWKSDLEAWLGGYGVNHVAGEINTWAGQVAGTQATAAANWPDLVASDATFNGHDTVDFDGTESFSCNGLAQALSERASWTMISVELITPTGALQYPIGLPAGSGFARNRVQSGYGRSYIGSTSNYVDGPSNAQWGAGLGVMAHRYSGSDAAPKLSVHFNGTLVSGAEAGTIPNSMPVMATGRIGSLDSGAAPAVMRLAALFLFGPALDPTLDLAPITTLLQARYIP